MKRLCLCLVCMLGLCSCAESASEPSATSVQTVSAAQEQESAENSEEPLLYRGEITALSEGQMTVTQLPGYDYGQESILFLLPEQAAEAQENGDFAPGMYVQATYDGTLTRSIPPQATALEVSVLAPMSDGVLWSGSIVSSTREEEGYRIELQAESPRQELVVLNVPEEALENMEEADLVEGARVLAVGNGAMTASLPPQMPVVALLPL